MYIIFLIKFWLRGNIEMGSMIELNDTLQITKEQGFPEELNYEKHKLHPYKAEDFKDIKLFI